MAAVFIAWTVRLRVWAGHDPDRYYYLALARLTAQGGVVRAWPQVEDLGWGRQFPGKEFLFQVVTGLAHWLGGEAAVLGLVAALGALTCSALLRPHLLAMLCFIGITWGALRGRAWLAAASATLYALSYHAFYLPLAPLLTAAALGALGGRRWWRAGAAGLGGLSLGTIANPYFPDSFLLGFRHLGIAVGAAAEQDIGSESVRLPLGVFALQTAVVAGLVVVGAARLAWLVRRQGPAHLRREEGRPSLELGGATVLAGGLWALWAINPRMAEYAMPVSVLQAALLVATFERRRQAIAAVAGLCLVLQGPLLAYHLSGEIFTRDVTTEALAAVARIPAAATGRKVFNCGFALSPFVLYARPDLRVVDVLEPNLLRFADPGKVEARRALREGRVADPWGQLRRVFDADFVLCSDVRVIEQLEADPHFQRLYPEPGRPVVIDPDHVVLYRLVRERVPAMVASWEQQLISVPREVARGFSEREAVQAAFSSPPRRAKGAWLDLDAAGSTPGEVRCAWLRPTPEEAARHAGATLAGLGGGRALRLFLNGALLYSTPSAVQRPRLIHTLVALPAPLSATDRLEAVVCAAAGSPEGSFGFALSLWSGQGLAEQCRWRLRPPSPGPVEQESCFGPIRPGQLRFAPEQP